MIFIFSITNLIANNIILGDHLINAGFHFIAYAFFTLVCIQYLYRSVMLKDSKLKSVVISFFVELVLLLTVKIFSVPFGKKVHMINCLTAFTGVLASSVISFLTCKLVQLKSARLGENEIIENETT